MNGRFILLASDGIHRMALFLESVITSPASNMKCDTMVICWYVFNAFQVLSVQNFLRGCE